MMKRKFFTLTKPVILFYSLFCRLSARPTWRPIMSAHRDGRTDGVSQRTCLTCSVASKAVTWRPRRKRRWQALMTPTCSLPPSWFQCDSQWCRAKLQQRERVWRRSTPAGLIGPCTWDRCAMSARVSWTSYKPPHPRYTVKISVYPRTFVAIFPLFNRRTVPNTLASINRRNSEARTQISMSLLRRFTHANINGTGSVKIWQSELVNACHHIFTVYKM